MVQLLRHYELMLALTNGQHRARRRADNFFRDGTQQHVGNCAPSVSANHDEVDILVSGNSDDLHERMSQFNKYTSLPDIQSGKPFFRQFSCPRCPHIRIESGRRSII